MDFLNQFNMFNTGRNIFRPVLFLVIISSFLFYSCGNGTDDSGSAFERSELLENYCDNIIIPGYHNFNEATIQLHDIVSDYADGSSSLYDCREELQSTWMSWQRVSPFAFGPAYNNLLNVTVNTFPVDIAQIELDIENGSWNPPVSEFDHFGLPAIDYILNYKNQHTDEEINRLLMLTNQLVALSTEVYNDWEQSYADDFKSSTGTELGSSLSSLLNAFNQIYEQNVRKQKLGLPVGISGSIDIGYSLPENVEAYYANTYSIELLYEALIAFEDLYNGDYYINGVKIEGVGLDDYLITLGEYDYGSALNDDILSQLASSKSAVLTLQNPLSDYVVNNRSDAIDVYLELQALVVLWKVDMMGSLGVDIIYQDNDGD